MRTKADGSFETPDNLMVGKAYRIAVRDPGKEPILSDWMTIGEKPRTLPPFVLRPLRAVAGRVVDRQGKPVANVEVFQSGDGPERRTTQTDTLGHFSLGGFRQGPVFLFVRGQGSRFQGQLVKPADRDVTVEVTRSNEGPPHALKMLPDPIPFEESQRLAQRLVEPLWDVAGRDGQDFQKFSALSALAVVAPARVLERLGSAKFLPPGATSRIQKEVAQALARTDFEEAEAVAESIADPAVRASALVSLADRLPGAERDRKKTLLTRALLHARTEPDLSDQLIQIGEIADLWYDLGDLGRAKELLAEGVKIAGKLPDKTDLGRAFLATRLAVVDLPAALALGDDGASLRSNIALRLVDSNPAEADRLWRKSRAPAVAQALAWKMATVDPARARRLVDEIPWISQRPQLYFLVAGGAAQQDKSLSIQALQAGLQGLDRLMQERPEAYERDVGGFLPLVERIDPALVPELFWRDVSSRRSFGNPRTLQEYSAHFLITRIAWYDREIAATLFEPSLARLDQASPDTPMDWSVEFRAWSLFDPRAAVARLEKMPIDPKNPQNAIRARTVVAESLALPHEERWHALWKEWAFTWGSKRVY